MCIQSIEESCPSIGLPLVRDPGVVPCIICFSKLSDFFLTICPKYDNFLAFTDSSLHEQKRIDCTHAEEDKCSFTACMVERL